MNAFDIDGVISIGVYPGPEDIIITGRSYEEQYETIRFLKSKGISNQVFFNPVKFDQKTREGSGKHKANTLNSLKNEYDISIEKFFEDDEIQAEVIRNSTNVYVVEVKSNLVEKENVRRICE